MPVALPPSNASVTDIGPCLISRVRTASVALSIADTSDTSPCGVFIVSVTVSVPPASVTVLVDSIFIDWPPSAIVTL